MESVREKHEKEEKEQDKNLQTMKNLAANYFPDDSKSDIYYPVATLNRPCGPYGIGSQFYPGKPIEQLYTSR